MAKQTVLKWGNSLAFRLPAALAREMNVAEGTPVTYSLKGRRLVVEAAEADLPPFSEADLKRAIRKAAPRLEAFGKPRGKEAW